MSYQVLARKWRPHNFSEIVGQEHVVKSLTNALQHDRLHHAYLFTGTRGVGKTTIARILAKVINCENRVDFNPCGECSVCRDVDEGRFLDLIEVDAASRTKVEDTRDLLDNAQYAPNAGKYKVYLIDEVHMLSGHSFNALLKTLEEPPPHVKFLLATTDPQKIPVTVLSRCLQFNLKRLQPQQIAGQFGNILEQEGITFEKPALNLLARAADGSMRDGLSLLDQAIVFANGTLQEASVRDMLGTVAQQPVADLMQALAQQDAVALVACIAGIAELSPDFADVLTQVLQILHRCVLMQLAPEAVAQDENADMISKLSSLFCKEELQLYYQIGLIGQRDLNLAPDSRSGFEMVMLRMLTFKPVDSAFPATPVSPLSTPIKPTTTSAHADSQGLGDKQTLPAVSKQSDNITEWSDIISEMKIGGMTRELANNCVLVAIDENTCQLLLQPAHKQLRSSRTEEKLQKALQNFFGRPLKLKIGIDSGHSMVTPAEQNNRERVDKQREAESAIANDENIQQLKENFDARVIPGSVEPVKK